MLSNLMDRVRSREGLLALVAQGAVTWGSNYLSAVIAGQAEQLDQLEAERDALALELLAAKDERDALAAELADLRLQAEQQPAYPTAEDVAPSRSSRDRTAPGQPPT